MPELAVPPRTTREEFERELLAFIRGPLSTRRATRGGPRDAFAIDGSTRLFETGLIDSLAIVDLLAFVEGAIGRRIPLRQIDMRYFGSVDRIVQTFWSESTEVES